MVFHWKLSDSKSPQVSRTILSTLADLNISVVLVVWARPLTFPAPVPSYRNLIKRTSDNWYHQHVYAS